MHRVSKSPSPGAAGTSGLAAKVRRLSCTLCCVNTGSLAGWMCGEMKIELDDLCAVVIGFDMLLALEFSCANMGCKCQ